MADDVNLAIRDVATLPKIGEKTGYTMAQAGEFPSFKVCGQWRFRRFEFGRWIDEQPRCRGDGCYGEE